MGISDNHTTHLQDGFHDAPTFQADLCAGRSFKDSFPFDRRPSPIIPQQQTRQLVLHVEEYDARYDTYESEICIQAEQDVYAAAGCASSWWKLDTFMHTGLGIGIIGLSARAMFQSGFTYRLMATNPWVVMIGGLALSIGTMMGTRATSPDNYIQKYGLWAGFNVTQGALLAPLLFMAPPALIARAGLYTVAMMGSISFVGATAKQEKYLYLGGPLLAGVALVAVSGFAPLVLPATAVRTLAFTENIWLYGGLAVFGG